jgi:hypothetical protein
MPADPLPSTTSNANGEKPPQKRQLAQVCEARLHDDEAVLADVVDSLIVNLSKLSSISQPGIEKSPENMHHE